MPVSETVEVDYVAASQEAENRLRSLESAVMILLGALVLKADKVKVDQAELVADARDCVERIAYTISNYPAE